MKWIFVWSAQFSDDLNDSVSGHFDTIFLQRNILQLQISTSKNIDYATISYQNDDISTGFTTPDKPLR